MKYILSILIFICVINSIVSAQNTNVLLTSIRSKNTNLKSYYINFDRILLPFGTNDTIFQKNCHAYVYLTDTTCYFRVVTPRNFSYIVDDPSGVYYYQVRNKSLMYNYQHRGCSGELFHPYFASFYDFIEKECRIISMQDDNQSYKLTFTPTYVDTTKDSFTKELFINKQDSMVYAETWYGSNSIYGKFYNKIIINKRVIFPNALDSILIENQPIEVSIVKDKLQEDKNWIARDTAFLNHKFDNIRFTDLEGKNLRLYSKRAKYYLIDFSYINCPPCLVLHQNLAKINGTLSEKNISVITLNGIDKDVNKLKNYMAKSGTKFPTYLCTKDVLKQYNVEGYPKVFILDDKFNVIYVSSGYSVEILHQIKLLD